MKKFFNISVPFWEVLLLLIGMSAGMLLMFSLFREQVFNYMLSLPNAEQNANATLSYGEWPALSDPNFFQKVKNDFLSQKANFIEADLSQMKLSVFKNGVLEKEVPILSKGKEGSWWETPAGIYKIQSKEENHFSTFGKVYQPWSMAFQGNFFIHGWPYYPDGTAVSSAYSGGCIRLATPDAEMVFGLVKVGTPVMVFKNDFSPDGFVYKLHTPELSATNILVADIQNNFVFMEKNKTEIIPVGVFSQLLGSLIATDYINIEKNIPLGTNTLSGVQSTRYKKGAQTTAFDLLHPMLLSSDENAFRIFANYLSPERFISLVNAKAVSVGMSHTEVGIEDGKTTPEDLFYLSKYLYNNRRFLLDISAGRQTNTAYEGSRFATLPNENLFAGQKSFVGGKALTNADGTQSFFGVFEISEKGEKRPIFIFLKDSADAKSESTAIIQYIQNSYN